MHFELPIDFRVMDCGTEIDIVSVERITGLHYHNCLEIGYCYEGSGIFIVDEKVSPTKWKIKHSKTQPYVLLSILDCAFVRT